MKPSGDDIFIYGYLSMDEIPTIVIYNEIVRKLPFKDQLGLAMTCKRNYSMLFEFNPAFRSLYGNKYKIGKCLRQMIDFVKRGEYNCVAWSWLTKGYVFTLSRKNKMEYMFINNTCHGKNEEAFIDLFEKIILPKCPDVLFSSRCWYKPASKQRCTFLTLSSQMNTLSNVCNIRE
jgi:hypothetical protein